MSDTIGLRVERRGPALWLVLDRPEQRNALTQEIALAATAAIESITDNIRAVVITGTGRVFCPGADSSMVTSVVAGGKEAVSSTIYGPLHGLLRAVAAAPVPVIAALNGGALGGGLDLALASDLRVAVPSAYLCSSWVGLGLVPGMGGAFWAARLLGATRASELLLLGERIPAARALEWGLLNAVSDDLEATVSAMVERLAELPRQGVMANKRALRRQRDAGLEAELELLGQEQAELITTPEFQEALRRARERS